jgi:hypothetical protein
MNSQEWFTDRSLKVSCNTKCAFTSLDKLRVIRQFEITLVALLLAGSTADKVTEDYIMGTGEIQTFVTWQRNETASGVTMISHSFVWHGKMEL